MTYISHYRHYETEKLRALGAEVRRLWEAMLRTPDPTKCTMSIPGLDTGDVFLPQTFTIKAKNGKGEDITAGGAPFHVYITLTDKPKAKKQKNAHPSRRIWTMRTTCPPLQMRRRSRGFLHGVP